MERATLKIGGMRCGHCVGAVSRVLGAMEGVEVDGVEIGAAVLRLDPSRTGRERIVRSLEGEGYSVGEWRSET